MNFYKAAGGLILGTRLKRLSDRFLQEVGQIYQELEIEFEPSWFPVFFLLREKGDLSMTDIAAAMDVSHSAISQMISSLRKRELIQLIEDPQDARRKKVSLTLLGDTLLQKVIPVWHSMQLAMPTLWESETRQMQFLEELDALEERLSQKVFSAKTLALVPALEFELVQLDTSKPNPAFEVFKADSEGRFLTLPEGVQIWGTIYKSQIIGALAMYVDSSNGLHLWQVFVQAEYRRKGLATSMIIEALQALNTTPNAALKVEDPQLPLIQLLIKAKLTFTVAPNN
ncbi:MAG: bifunctional helix-turn-helix transcriptional regulator/GNAT family N-acetyltransferase [Saprospiraceae bacterium]|nr:bifunctional helix-turn-helix transcriptional regulator/GNAT family N-acetyltransferase [Saprospiraceae bacterium]